MVAVKDIGWGAYSSYEGPAFHGKVKTTFSTNPDVLEQYLIVLCATESGGYLDAYNGWDRCICTVGLIQWCEAAPQFSVSNMLGLVADRCGINYVLQTLKPALDVSKSTFKKNSSGQWRFFFLDDRGEVNTTDKQKQLFWNGTGLKGSWTDANKIYAKQWAACMANIWVNPDAQKAQIDYTKPKLLNFVMKDAKAAIFDVGDSTSPWVLAVRAAFISFAANLPLNASKSLAQAIKESKFEKWSKEWCYDVLYYLTYAPNITIYSIRYNAIRPVLEKFWGVTLPKTAEELKKREWLNTPVVPPVAPVVVVEEQKTAEPPIVAPVVEQPTKPAHEEPVKPGVSIVTVPTDDTQNNSQNGLWLILVQLLQFILKLFKKQ